MEQYDLETEPQKKKNSHKPQYDNISKQVINKQHRR